MRMFDYSSALPYYYSILEDEKQARYLRCKYTPVVFSLTDSLDELWSKHDYIIKNPPSVIDDTIPKQSLLDLKIEIAERIFKDCCFCERSCHVNRYEKTGMCGVKDSCIASEFLHIGEEHILVPSYTIFFSGCTFKCVFCQNYDISQYLKGSRIEPKLLALMIKKRKKQGARNVNYVGGDPTSNTLFILKVLKECDVNIPMIWNSNMYCSVETMKLLDGVIDVYLTDFKYGNDRCAQRLSSVKGYTGIIKRNHLICYQQSEVIVRHLVLPNHTVCCSEPVIRWIHDNIKDVVVNIMPQYHPEYKACEHPDISRHVSADEYKKVVELAEKLDLILI
ncbi:MAG: radical SAM protein [Candidatus Thermoplasmatota archaeon]